MASGVIDLGQSKNTLGRITWESSVNGANSSSVSAKIQVRKSSDTTEGTTGTWSGALNIGGTSQSFDYYGTIYQSWLTLHTFSITKNHSSDGTGTCYISGQINAPSGTSQAGASVYGNDTVTLDYIPKQAVITSAPNFTDEENPTIKYSNPAGYAADSLDACISLTGAADDIAYRAISKTGSSYTFNLTTAERNVLRNATKNDKSRTVRFYVRCAVGGEVYLSDLTKTLTIVNAEPTVSGTVEDVNPVTLALTGDKNKMVRYFSNAKYTMTATGNKGATITSKSVSNGSFSSSATSGTINGVENADFLFRATDSRGYTKTSGVYKTLVSYVKLTCNIVSSKMDAAGNMLFNVKGNYFNSSFGAANNTLQVFYRYKGGEVEDYTEWASMTVSPEGNKYTASASITGLDYQAIYTFQAYAVDKLATIYTEETPLKATPIFDWSQEDFNLNVSLNIKDKTVLRSNGDNNNIILSAEDAADGIFIRPNGTGSNVGQTIFYKDGTIRVGNAYYNKDQLVWEGGYYMTDAHRVNFGFNMRECPNGIVICFSEYNKVQGTPSEVGYNSFFIPKGLMSTMAASHSFMLVGYNYDIGFKALRIDSSGISGDAKNNQSGTAASGIKYDNSKFVLRYVFRV